MVEVALEPLMERDLANPLQSNEEKQNQRWQFAQYDLLSVVRFE
jgi:hypothetical protein